MYTVTDYNKVAEMACIHNNEDVLTEMIRLGADNLNLFIIFAVSNDNVSMLHDLIEMGANNYETIILVSMLHKSNKIQKYMENRFEEYENEIREKPTYKNPLINICK